MWRCRAAAAERLRLHDAAEGRLTEIVARLRGRHELAPLVLRDSLPAVATASRYPREVFERDVARILDYIRAGDTFQTVLSRRQEAAGAVDPLLLYRYLRALNPAPYLFYLAPLHAHQHLRGAADQGEVVEWRGA